ncbi:MAG: flavodoxin family protein [Methanomassiliicoccales archaeon]|nr:flavodoxin family protein [Methanomassiliicoccales archaeon]
MVTKVLGILGSPCLRGNTSDLLDAALRGAAEAGAETERLELARMSLRPCMECRKCDSGASCVQKKDDMQVIYSRIRQVDAIILASPIFFMSVTAQTKQMIDRCQCFWVQRYVLKQRIYEGRVRPKGLFISCAGSPKPVVFEPARHVVKAFFAAIDYEYAGEVFLGYTDDPALAPRKQTALEQAETAGKMLFS